MSQDSNPPDPLMARAVSEENRTRALVIRCPTGDEGTMYTLKPGELLSRRLRSGWRMEKRTCACDKCGHRQVITVQVRG